MRREDISGVGEVLEEDRKHCVGLKAVKIVLMVRITNSVRKALFSLRKRGAFFFSSRY